MDLKSFTSAITQIAEEKGISQEKVLGVIEMAIASAYKKEYGRRGQNIKAKLNPETGELKFWQIKLVVDESMIYSEEELKEMEELKGKKAEAAEPVKESKEISEEEKKLRFSPERHIMLQDAKKTKPDIKPGEELEFDLESKADFGRIAAQTAKQVILQRIKEAEREAILEEFKAKEGELLSGIVQRIEGKTVFIDLGRIVGIILPQEQIPREFYRLGQRLKLYVLKVELGPKEPQVLVSRSYPKLLTRLFELEVPEVSAGTVEIKAIAREPGSRSKVAVVSTDKRIDPIGSMVGQKGSRISTVTNELGGEKIDIINWSEEPAEYIANSLSPAKVLEVKVQKRRNQAVVIVPEDQVSLAIGREGQNVRLAAKLTGWKIDIRSKGKPEESALPEELGDEVAKEAEEAKMGEGKDKEKEQ